MIQTNETYQRIRASSGSHYEVNVVVKHTGAADTVYGMDKLKTCKITQGLFSKKPPTMGGTVASECKLTLLEEKENWPRGGAFSVRVRVWDEEETEYSDWMTLGQFYTDTRVQDGSTLEIYGLDAMIQFEQSWTDKVAAGSLPTSWPITASAATNLICGALDFQLATGTTLDNQYKFVGLKTAVTAEGTMDPVDETFTARDTLASVASAMGANWHITPDGKLRLVPFATGGVIPGSAAIAGIAVAGITIVGTTLPSGNESSINADYIVVGASQFAHLETGVPTPAVHGVELTAPDGTVVSTGAEYKMKAVCDFSNSEAATLAATKLDGFIYRPFSVTRCELDPRVEVGDVAIIEGVSYQIMSATWTLGKHIFCSFEAPYDAEQEHEYAVQSETAKAMLQTEKVEEKLLSTITQTANNITLSVSQTYETKVEASDAYDELDGKISVNADKISLVVKLDEEDPSGGFKIKAAEIVAAINEDGESHVSIDADKVDLSGYVTISSLGAGGSTVIDGSRIQTGTLDANRIKAGTLSADMIKTGTMSADRISGGTINANTISVTNLNASNISSGTLNGDRVGNLGASKITSGQFATGRIPNLDCDKITTGTFTESRIPNLSANKITTGTLDASKVTVKNLDADYITAGTLSASRISGGTLDCKKIKVENLSASSITSGTLDADSITVKNLHVQSIYSTGTNGYLAYMYTTTSSIVIGKGYTFDTLNLHARSYINFWNYAQSNGIAIDMNSQLIRPQIDNKWSLGTSTYGFKTVYTNTLNCTNLLASYFTTTTITVKNINGISSSLTIGTSSTGIGFFGKSPVSRGSIALGSNTNRAIEKITTELTRLGLISGWSSGLS